MLRFFFMAVITALICVLVPVPRAHAASLALMRRWVVFPFDTTNPTLRNAAENAWWKCRERITETKKYLVASRQFLIEKDAFQPRRSLKPDDVKLLAKLMDADVIVTGFSAHREFTLNVYLAQNGARFWSKKMSFHPSLSASDQLELISDKLTEELLDRIPYQGFTVSDPLIGKTVYEDGGKQYAVVDLGITTDVTPGTAIQWVDVNVPDEPEPSSALEDSKIKVVGEGVITKVKRGVVIAQLQKAESPDAVKEGTLVLLPDVASRLNAKYQTGDPLNQERLSPELVPTVITPVVPHSQDARRNTMIFGGIFGVLGILLLAF